MHAGTGNNEWAPSIGDKDAMGIDLMIVRAREQSDNTSEESILLCGYAAGDL